jgi:hypothetical protein
VRHWCWSSEAKDLPAPCGGCVMPLPGVAGRPSRAPRAVDSVEQRLDHFQKILRPVRFCDLAWLVWLRVLAGLVRSTTGAWITKHMSRGRVHTQVAELLDRTITDGSPRGVPKIGSEVRRQGFEPRTR